MLQLQKRHRQFLAELVRHAPLPPGADLIAFLDIDSQQKRIYARARRQDRGGGARADPSGGRAPRSDCSADAERALGNFVMSRNSDHDRRPRLTVIFAERPYAGIL